MDTEKSILTPETWAIIESKWPGIKTPSPIESNQTTATRNENHRPRHTCPSMIGEFTYGPWYWQLKRSIPWSWINKADSLGTACQHVRIGLLSRIFYESFQCDFHRPARLSIDDSSHVGVDAENFHRLLDEMDTAGLLHVWREPGQKSRVVPKCNLTRLEIGRWKTCRNIWWPPISMICGTMPAVSVLTYMFLTMHLTKRTNRATVDSILPGWTRRRRDFERGVKPLIESGLVRREKIRQYTLPVLGGPDPDVAIFPSWTGATLPASFISPPSPPPRS